MSMFVSRRKSSRGSKVVFTIVGLIGGLGGTALIVGTLLTSTPVAAIAAAPTSTPEPEATATEVAAASPVATPESTPEQVAVATATPEPVATPVAKTSKKAAKAKSKPAKARKVAGK